MSVMPQRPLGFGEILDGAIQFYRRDFGLYFLIALAGGLPGFAMLLALGAPTTGLDAAGNPDFAGLFFDLLVLLLATVVSWVGTVAVAVAMRDRLTGARPSIETAYQGALRPFPSSVGAYALAVLLVGAVGTVCITVVGLVALPLGLAGSLTLAIVFLVPAGLLTVLVTLSLWSWSTFAILPTILLEGRSATAAIRRSFALSKGARLRVLGVMLVVLIIENAFSTGALFFSGGLTVFTSPATAGTVGGVQMAMINAVNLLIGALTSPFGVAAAFFLHHDRRARLEASDLETAAAAMATDQP